MAEQNRTGSDAEQNADAVTKVAELIKGQRICMITTNSADGLVSRPMTCLDTEFDGTLWYLGLADSPLANELAANPSVNVAFTERSSWVSLRGNGSATHDPERAKQLWSDFAKDYFQCEPDDPKVAVIRVDAEGAEYWDSPGPVGMLLDIAKARVTGKRPNLGVSGSADL